MLRSLITSLIIAIFSSSAFCMTSYAYDDGTFTAGAEYNYLTPITVVSETSTTPTSTPVAMTIVTSLNAIASANGFYVLDLEAYANLDNVPTITDYGTNASSATQSNGAKIPVYYTEQTNSINVVRFDNTTDDILSAMASTSANITMFVVVNPSALDGTSSSFVGWGDATETKFKRFGTYPSGVARPAWYTKSSTVPNNTRVWTANGLTAGLGATRVYSIKQQGMNNLPEMRSDGVTQSLTQITLGNVVDIQQDVLGIGSKGYGVASRHFGGDIYLFWYTNAVLTYAQIDAIEYEIRHWIGQL